MKKILTGLSLILSILSYAQSNLSIKQKIDSLKNLNLEYASLIEKNDQLIKKLNEDLILTENSLDSVISIPIITTKSIFIRKTPSIFDRETITLPRSENLIIIGYKNEFFIVKFRNDKGYAYYSDLPMNEELLKIKEYGTLKEKRAFLIQLKKQQEENNLQYQKEAAIQAKVNKENDNIRKQKLIKKYGISIAEKIESRKIWIGMSKEMALDSWGEPEDINRTVTNYATNEQWVYSDKTYLYFENGKLTAWQD